MSESEFYVRIVKTWAYDLRCDLPSRTASQAVFLSVDPALQKDGAGKVCSPLCARRLEKARLHSAGGVRNETRHLCAFALSFADRSIL